MILQLKEIVNNKVITTGNKELYNSDNNSASKWIRKEIGNKKTQDAPQITSAIGIKQKGRGKIIHNALGYIHNNGNNIYCNIQLVGLYSSAFSGAHGFSIIPENFRKVVSLFTARKSIKGNWVNDKDEYLIPKYL